MGDREPIKVPDNTEFLATLGRCITDWAMIEEQLFYMCREILAVTNEQAAIIYYRTPTLETRLQLTDELIVDTFPKPERKNGGHPTIEIKLWATLLADIRETMPIRNQLAHQPVGVSIFATTDEAGQILEIGRMEVQSYPAQTEIMRGRSDGKAPLSLDDLKKYHPKIIALFNRVLEFRRGPLKDRLAKRAPQDRARQTGQE